MHTRLRNPALAMGVGALCLCGAIAYSALAEATSDRTRRDLAPIAAHAVRLLAEGQRVFRFDTFGDEQFWGGVSHWNAFVANLEMHGQGTFYDPRLNDPVRFPVAARAGFGNVRAERDLITSKLPALQFYQLALDAPKPPRHSFDARRAKDGAKVFNKRADCARCHVPPLFTEPGWNMHTAAEIGIDDFQAQRAPDGAYRTTPLRGLFTRLKGGFYHDGRFKTYEAVVDHYNGVFNLKLTAEERRNLVEYLKSL